jgi:hypothetical protein
MDMLSPRSVMMPRPLRQLLPTTFCLVAAACSASARTSRADRELATGTTACDLHGVLMDTTRFVEARRLLDDSVHSETVKRLTAAADSIMADTAMPAQLGRLMVDTRLHTRLTWLMADTAVQTQLAQVSRQLDSLLADRKRRCGPRRPS